MSLPLDKWERMTNYARQTRSTRFGWREVRALLTEELLTPKQRRRMKKKFRKNGF